MCVRVFRKYLYISVLRIMSLSSINHTRIMIKWLKTGQFLSRWFCWVSWCINPSGLFNAKFSLYIYIRYIIFGLVGFYGISTIVGYSMPNPLYTYILNIYNLVWFYGISTLVDYLMQNPLYTYILNIYDLVCLSFNACKP